MNIVADGSILPSLLVMPKSLIFNWESEIARFAPWLSTYTYYGVNRILMRHAEPMWCLLPMV